MTNLQSNDESIIKFITKNIYPMAIRDFIGTHLLVNDAWSKILGDVEGKKLSDIVTVDPVLQSNLAMCKTFDSLIQNYALILNETFNYQSYMVFRSPIIYKNKQCILIQVVKND